VVVAIDGTPVRNLFDLTSLLDERSVGEEVEVAALRGVDGPAPERLTLRATLQAEGA
jgi:S1-C subfamily serine protease